MKTIKDGIINPVEFNKKSNLKLLWILKEGNVADGDENLERDICEEFRLGYHQKHALAIPTFRKIIYASYWSHHQSKDWSELPYANEDEAYSILNKIAYININKFPAKNRSDYYVVQNYYYENRKKLLLQINEINPDVIIFGGTFKFFEMDDLASIGWEIKEKEYFDKHKIGTTTEFYKTKNNRLCINAYHPSYIRVSNEQYALEIKDIIKNNGIV